jgi:hypothetical protein
MTANTSGSSSAGQPAPNSAKKAEESGDASAGQAPDTVRARQKKVTRTAPTGPTVPGPNTGAKRATASKAKAADKQKKPKLVRDSFTMPAVEYKAIAAMKERCLAQGVAVKKSEILRAAIRSFEALKDAALLRAIEQLEPIKTGRPAKAKK